MSVDKAPVIEWAVKLVGAAAGLGVSWSAQPQHLVKRNILLILGGLIISAVASSFTISFASTFIPAAAKESIEGYFVASALNGLFIVPLIIFLNNYARKGAGMKDSAFTVESPADKLSSKEVASLKDLIDNRKSES
jgi:uncharacterized membrane protein